jgi:hypothetical protein
MRSNLTVEARLEALIAAANGNASALGAGLCAQCTTGLRGSARTALKSICESSISSTSPITAL